MPNQCASEGGASLWGMSMAAGGYGVQTIRDRRHERQRGRERAAEPEAEPAARKALMPARLRSRGSIAAQATSTRKLRPMTRIAISITQSSTTSVSRLEIDCSIRRPRPGRTNTFSTTIAPAIRLANCRPMIVSTGTSAFGSASRHSAARRDTPLARAVRM